MNLHAIEVQVAEVTPELTEGNVTMYKLRLSCGCVFWEHRPSSEPPPELGKPVNCYNLEHQRRTAPPLPLESIRQLQQLSDALDRVTKDAHAAAEAARQQLTTGSGDHLIDSVARRSGGESPDQ